MKFKYFFGISIFLIGLYIIRCVADKNNDFFYYSRIYQVIDMNGGGHTHKGNYYNDYFITIRYGDDNSVWVKQVSGVNFFSKKLNSRYIERKEKSNYSYFVIIGFICLIIPISYIIYKL